MIRIERLGSVIEYNGELICNGTYIYAGGASKEEVGDWLLNLINPSERFPQPVWFDEAMRRGK